MRAREASWTSALAPGVIEISSIPLAIVDVFHPKHFAGLVQCTPRQIVHHVVHRTAQTHCTCTVHALWADCVCRAGGRVADARRTQRLVSPTLRPEFPRATHILLPLGRRHAGGTHTRHAPRMHAHAHACTAPHTRHAPRATRHAPRATRHARTPTVYAGHHVCVWAGAARFRRAHPR